MLTIEQQKRLTEFLGECWHEWKKGLEEPWFCPKCGKRGHFQQRLDFSDWRVVGRLVEKLYELRLYEEIGPYLPSDEYSVPFKEAICLAIDSYLKEREGK